jgi:hypothetical protein
MRAVKLTGWLIVAAVLFLLGTDLYAVIAKGATHPVVTWEHVIMLLIAILGIGMASDEVTARIVRMALAFRGKGGSGDG